MNGAQSLLETFVAAGVDVCFTNPGTSEMHFVAALDQQPGMRAVLGLFEGVVTGAADGYARMAGKPACTLLHLGPGLANGLANLHNARRARSPIVNVVGEHATYHRALDAPLASDIEGFASPVSGWIRVSEQAASVARDAAAARLGQSEGIVVVARTDARQAASLEEALWRVGAFAEAGADVLFVDALETEAEMRAFASEAQAQGLPALANMLEGGGKTPILTPAQLEDAGFSVAAYPLSLLGVSVRAMQRALQDLRQGRVPQDAVPFPELQKTLGFPEYFEEVEYYEAYGRGFVARAQQKPGSAPEEGRQEEGRQEEGRKEAEKELEAEGPLREGKEGAESPPGLEIIVPEVLGGDGGSGEEAEGGRGEPRSLVGVERIRFIISNLRTGADEINVCVPAAILGVGLKSIRATMEELNLAKAMGEVETAVEAGTVLDFTAGDYRIQILEG